MRGWRTEKNSCVAKTNLQDKQKLSNDSVSITLTVNT